ncbi:MAG: TPM domain-containing protein [Ignavibacteriota bacterium]
MSAHSQPHKHVKEIFTKAVLDRIAGTIATVEQTTSAEIRVSIREERDHDESGLSIEDIAKREFLKLSMDQTSGKNGILLFILFEERKYYVYGDIGIHERVDPGTWEDVAAALKGHFSHGHFEQGIRDALNKISTHVNISFVPTQENPNELSNDVVIG